MLLRRILLLFVDVACIAVATIMALWLRENLQISTDRLIGLLPYLGFSAASALVFFPVFGTHRGIWRYSGVRTFVRIAIAACVAVALAVTIGFAFDRMESVARSIPIIQAVLAIGLMTSLRVALHLRQQARDLSTVNTLTAPAREIVLVHGINSLSELYLRSTAELAPGRIQIAGIIGRSERHANRLFKEIPVLGAPEDVARVVRDLAVHGIFVNRIILTMARDTLSDAAAEALDAVRQGSDIVVETLVDRLAPIPPSSTHQPPFPRGPGEPRQELSLKSLLDDGVLKNSYWAWKRVFDITASALLLATLAPLIAIIGLVVLFDVGAPAIFWQQRPGRFGRPFRLFKFRTMVSAYDADGNAVPDAQRSSLIGKVLRATRLDELPQLWNILVGEMSFVGPRPLLHVDQSHEHSARLAVAPGLTGWAQVNGGRAISPSDKTALDIWYIRHASFALDFKIALKTVVMIVYGEKIDPEAIKRAWLEVRQRVSVPTGLAVEAQSGQSAA